MVNDNTDTTKKASSIFYVLIGFICCWKIFFLHNLMIQYVLEHSNHLHPRKIDNI